MPLTPDLIPLQQALLGRYSIERELGRGGMGSVYLARDVRLERPVAIKVLHPALAADPAARERFVKEARTSALLAHPHIVPIYGIEYWNDLVIIVLELVDGETLGTRIRRSGPLNPAETEQLIREIGWALGYAHAHGVVHRDLTLENVLIEHRTGRALLADFGLAGEHLGEEEQPRFGTPGYLAPEVIRGDTATPSSDFYSLGVVAWIAITGTPPYSADTSSALLAKHLLQPLPPLAPLARGASRRVVSAIEACLAKLPADRPQDAVALLAMLDRAPEPFAVAPPLRRWFTRWERIAPIYSVATPLLAMEISFLAHRYTLGGPGQFLTLTLVAFTLGMSILPLTAQAIFEALEMRRVRAEGYGIDDIRASMSHWANELKQERDREGLRPLASRVVFDLTAIAILTLLVIAFVFERIALAAHPERSALTIWIASIVFSSTGIYIAAMIGIGIGFVSPGYRISPRGVLRGLINRVWQSRLAGVFAEFVGKGQSSQLTASATLHRPTAMVLGLAVDDLWKAMPDSLRANLGDVPGLAHTLQASATELRGMITRLDEGEAALSGELTDTSITTLRESLEGKHKEAVLMLEQLRLQLLRLLATRQQTSELTQQLDAARALENVLLREVVGHDEVRRLLNKSRRRGTQPRKTPTPSPAAA